MDKNNALSAVVKQPYIKGGTPNLSHIKDLLTYNGFENIKRQDFFNRELGLLLEDMHDENVIAKDDILFFIDTVFYILDRNRLP